MRRWIGVNKWWLLVSVVLLVVAIWGVFFQKVVEVKEIEVPVSADLTEVENRLDELQERQKDIAKALTDLPKEIASAMPEMPEAVVVAAEEPSPPVTPTTEPTEVTVRPTVQCSMINDYDLLEFMDHLSTSGSQIHVEYWWEGEPERETFLPTVEVKGGRYNLTRGLKGHIWEYANCTNQEVLDQIMAHINRRLAGGANNAGYVKWETTGLFQPVQ